MNKAVATIERTEVVMKTVWKLFTEKAKLDQLREAVIGLRVCACGL